MNEPTAITIKRAGRIVVSLEAAESIALNLWRAKSLTESERAFYGGISATLVDLQRLCYAQYEKLIAVKEGGS